MARRIKNLFRNKKVLEVFLAINKGFNTQKKIVMKLDIHQSDVSTILKQLIEEELIVENVTIKKGPKADLTYLYDFKGVLAKTIDLTLTSDEFESHYSNKITENTITITFLEKAELQKEIIDAYAEPLVRYVKTVMDYKEKYKLKSLEELLNDFWNFYWRTYGLTKKELPKNLKKYTDIKAIVKNKLARSILKIN